MNDWPALPYDDWRETRATLHMYTQVIGKIRLALSPFEPGWANVPLYLTSRGLTTSPIPVGLRTVDAEFDLIDHVLVLRSSDGDVERRLLGGPVADFYQDVVGALARLRVDVTISPVPSEVPDPIAFPEDRRHLTYNPAHAHRFWRVLSMVDVVLKQHRAAFRGRTTPVQFFWGSFDLALTRFSGRPATPPADAGIIARFGGDAEQICAGWWPGDERFPHAAFFAYGYPKPDGVEHVSIRPSGAHWSAEIGEFLLPYAAVRAAPDPRAAILAFVESTYEASAALMGWSSDLTHGEVPGSSSPSRPHPGTPPTR
ncbi:MAG TPA: DUF5996 family protein [Candidatus Dormibacteraeota bacterium]